MNSYIAAISFFLVCMVTAQPSNAAEFVISKDGTKIFYEVQGEGPTIVLLHGLGSNRSDWARAGFIDKLRNFRLILVDARGHGDSDSPLEPNGFAMNRFVDDLEAILLEESDPAPIFWGYSMGAAVGFHIMLHKPELFSRYILADGMSGIYGRSPTQRTTEQSSAKVLRIQASRAFAGSKKTPNAMADYIELDRSIETETIRNRLGVIAIPTFIYRSGEGQEYVLDAEERTNFYIPHHFLNLDIHTFPKLTHGDLMGRSELVAPRVLEYLERFQN